MFFAVNNLKIFKSINVQFKVIKIAVIIMTQAKKLLNEYAKVKVYFCECHLSLKYNSINIKLLHQYS